MTVFCSYSVIFGLPGKGVHSIRFLNLAIVDVGMTVLAAYLFHLYFRVSFWLVLFVLFLLGVIFHRLFCVRTTIDKLLFPK